MRSLRLFMAACVFLFLASATSIAGPISQSPEACAASSGSVDVNGFITFVGCSSKDLSSMQLRFTDSHVAHDSAAHMVIAGMWPLQEGNVEVIQEVSRKSVDSLMLVFAGSLLISISGFIKRVFRDELKNPDKYARIHAHSPYQEILSVQT